MPLSITDVVSVLQNGVVAVQRVATQLGKVFPQVGALSTSATTGTISYNSSQPTAFLTVTVSSGATYKVPLFSP